MNENGTGVALAAPEVARHVVRQEFSATEIGPRMDATTTALAAQARAEVEARIIAARRWPRDIDNVRVRLLESCRRPRFAQVARYAKPLGRKLNDATGQWEQQYARGWSVRFAEEAARTMGNLHSGVIVVADDDAVRVCRAFVADLETNTYREEIVTVTKTIERSKLKQGQEAIRSRLNSSGKVVHVVEATDDEVNVKQAALVQKAWRNLIVRMVPGDILDECLDQLLATQEKGDAAEDPAAVRKKIADSFAQLNVMPSDLKEYLDHDLSQCSPAELQDLRVVYVAVQQNETTWREVIEARRAERAEEQATTTTKPAPAPVGLQAKAEAKKAEREKKKDATPPKQITVAGTDGNPIDSTDLKDEPPPADDK